ncbi:MAG: GH92 family glycosyl hydrolase [Bacteroidales bacterium]
MKKIIFLSCFSLILLSCNNQKEITDYVDPFIGTDAHGHVYPGAAMPFGMVQLSPDTRKDSWDGCSGYHYSDSTIMGFSHTHLSGTGVGDYGDIRLMPTAGAVQLDPGTEEAPETGYRSRFSHDNEEAAPGYYRVLLDDYNINAELTVTERAGMHRYTFPESEQGNIIIDLTEGVTSDRILELWIEIVGDNRIRGLRRTDGWADNQYVYFDAEFSKPFESFGVRADGKIFEGKRTAQGKDVKGWVGFKTRKGEQVMVKVGISAVSADGALNNRQTEMPAWKFKQVRQSAIEAWKKELGKIEVEGDDDRKEVFYTALYHALLNPNLYSDVDGKYRGHDNNIHTADGHRMYTVFSLWDTYRAAHPLLTIIDRERTGEFIQTMLRQYEQGGLLPVWELAANETNCMIGYHAVPVIVDAYMKGIRSYNTNQALEACMKSAMQDQFGLEWYKTKGYIPAGKESESVSKTLEYAYDDWCIAQLAKDLGKQETYETFIKRAQNYKNLYDPSTGFMRARSNETWFSPFDPWEVNFNYTEANAWQYSMYVPQDVSGLMQLMGGPDKLEARLDELFSAEAKTTGRHQADITGLIGQYAHGNEPSHHMAYLYNYTGQPWKTQETVRRIMDELYTSQPDGLCGNEDCGQMSAWYVLSAMGFYPVTPGSNIYAVGSPVFDKVTIHLENGSEFIIEVANQNTDNKFIQTATFNRAVYSKSFITHDMLMQDAYLVFEMGSRASHNWGNAQGERPVSEITDHLITPVPFLTDAGKVFFDREELRMGHADPQANITYTLKEKGKQPQTGNYTKPLVIQNSATLTATATAPGKTESLRINAAFEKIPPGRTITIKHPYANQYNAGGDVALIDFQRGGTDFRTGLWQGYQGVDLDAVIDLGKKKDIRELKTGFLQDINAWIFMPDYVEYSVSDDGKNFRKLGRIENPVAEDDWDVQTRDFRLILQKTPARYIRVLAKNKSVCPDWHKGAGNPCWIFADEVVVR